MSAYRWVLRCLACRHQPGISPRTKRALRGRGRSRRTCRSESRRELRLLPSCTLRRTLESPARLDPTSPPRSCAPSRDTCQPRDIKGQYGPGPRVTWHEWLDMMDGRRATGALLNVKSCQNLGKGYPSGG